MNLQIKEPDFNKEWKELKKTPMKSEKAMLLKALWIELWQCLLPINVGAIFFFLLCVIYYIFASKESKPFSLFVFPALIIFLGVIVYQVRYQLSDVESVRHRKEAYQNFTKLYRCKTFEEAYQLMEYHEKEYQTISYHFLKPLTLLYKLSKGYELVEYILEDSHFICTIKRSNLPNFSKQYRIFCRTEYDKKLDSEILTLEHKELVFYKPIKYYA